MSSKRRLTQLTRLEAAKAKADDLDGSLLVFGYGDGYARRWRGYDHAMVIEALRPGEHTNG